MYIILTKICISNKFSLVPWLHHFHCFSSTILQHGCPSHTRRRLKFFVLHHSTVLKLEYCCSLALVSSLVSPIFPFLHQFLIFVFNIWHHFTTQFICELNWLIVLCLVISLRLIWVLAVNVVNVHISSHILEWEHA